jgi:hypothetical protein
MNPTDGLSGRREVNPAMSVGAGSRSAEEAEQQEILAAGFAGLVPPPGDELQDVLADPDCAGLPPWQCGGLSAPSVTARPGWMMIS